MDKVGENARRAADMAGRAGSAPGGWRRAEVADLGQGVEVDMGDLPIYLTLL